MRKIRIEDGMIMDADNGLDLRCPNGGTCELECVACVVHDGAKPIKVGCSAFTMTIGEIDAAD